MNAIVSCFSQWLYSKIQLFSKSFLLKKTTEVTQDRKTHVRLIQKDQCL